MFFCFLVNHDRHGHHVHVGTTVGALVLFQNRVLAARILVERISAIVVALETAHAVIFELVALVESHKHQCFALVAGLWVDSQIGACGGVAYTLPIRGVLDTAGLIFPRVVRRITTP